MQIAVIGLDLAKNVFQVHGIDDSERAVLKRKLRRSEVLPFFAGLDAALVGIEACHTAHYCAHFAEFGIVVGQRIRNVERLLVLLETGRRSAFTGACGGNARHFGGAAAERRRNRSRKSK